MMITERYEYTAGNSYKFWEVEYPKDGNQTEGFWRVTWGRIGTAGQSKSFDGMTAGRAHGEARAKIREKLDKGYVLIGIPFAQPTPFLPIQKVKLTPAPKFQNYSGGNKPTFCDVIAPPGSTFCGYCNGTGKFMRAFGRLDPCRQCGGTGADQAIPAPLVEPLPSPALRKFDWSDA